MDTPTQICPKCNLPVSPVVYFCPNCGTQLKQKLVQISGMKQLGLYLLSFFLAPLGLYFAIKYLKQSDPQTRIVGWIIIVLTFLSISLTFFFVGQFFEKYTVMLDQLSTGQFSGY